MKNYLLNSLMAALVGFKFFDSVKDIVAGLGDENITGAEKRRIAEVKVKKLFNEAKPFIINFAIEAAVYLFKNYASNMAKK